MDHPVAAPIAVLAADASFKLSGDLDIEVSQARPDSYPIACSNRVRVVFHFSVASAGEGETDRKVVTGEGEALSSVAYEGTFSPSARFHL